MKRHGYLCADLPNVNGWHPNGSMLVTANSTRIRALAGHTRGCESLARAPVSAGCRGLNIEFERGFGGKLRWLIRLQTGI